jgi:chemotaxis protein methyltransferase CheR
VISDKAALGYLAGLLEARTGQQIGPNRLWRVETVLKSLMRARGIPSLTDLVTILMAGRDRALGEAVVTALLNNETFFFRDAPAFEQLQAGALEALRLARASTRRLSLWSAGCSTGQEAYSLAMIFADAAARWEGWTIDIVATDVSDAAIGRAREGVYSQFEIQRGLPIKAMLSWFEQQGEDWRVKPQLAGRVRFKRHHLIDEPMIGRFDVVLCRNVLLYFSAEHRRAAFDRIATAIAPDGYLMLGAGETVIGQTDSFVADPELRGLYRPAALLKRQAA